MRLVSRSSVFAVIVVSLLVTGWAGTAGGGNPDRAGGALGAKAVPAGAWTKFQPPFPVERDSPGLAYDAARQELVLFGGNNSDPPYLRSDTWTFDGSAWSPLSPAASPSARQLPAMAYHPGTQTVVLFGGFDPFGAGGGELGDTWTWDGSTWTPRAPAASPPARYGAGIALDPASGRVLLFGGYGAAGELGDTWSWDGSTWTQEAPATSPPPRAYPAMAVHPDSGTVVLFGGFNFFGGYSLGDTWTWDGTTWTAEISPGSPPGRSQAAMAPDVEGDVVLFGGNTGTFQDDGDTWTWNGSAWTLRSAAGPPAPRSAAAMAFHEAAGTAILFGGRNCPGVSCDYLDDTWAWGGAGWTEPPVGHVPPRRAEAGFDYDAARGEAVLFGGWNHMENLGDTWVWDGAAWTERNPATTPPARSLHGLAYDAPRANTVLFGGAGTAIRYGDTWTWDGTNWTLRIPLVSPPPRYGGVMAYDAVRQEVVLFGGSGVGGTYLNDTWVWNGTTWSQRNPPVSPPPRYRPGMAFDAKRGEMVLFGGFDSSFEKLADTWVWDGSTWTQPAAPAGPMPGAPTPRYSPAMAHHTGLSVTLLFGGSNEETEFADTWAWDGTLWTELAVQGPPAAHSANMAYDPEDKRVVLFGGSSLELGALRETWRWGAAPTAVTLVSFEARSTRRGTELRWRTGSQAQILGFNIFRSDQRATRRINAGLIVARPGASGASYRFVDRGVRPRTGYTYRLQLVGADGSRTWSRSVRAVPRFWSPRTG